MAPDVVAEDLPAAAKTFHHILARGKKENT
jgi:hypothetical protein